MGKLSLNKLKYLTENHIKVLEAIEKGMESHKLVPGPLITALANLQDDGVGKLLNYLNKRRLVTYEVWEHDEGFRLTNTGYDYLALSSLTSRGVVASIGEQIGLGDDTDIYAVTNKDSEVLCFKLHRLESPCFRKLRLLGDGCVLRNKTRWLHLSRLSAVKEFAYMTVLHSKDFPVPRPIECHRHCVLMELVQGEPLYRISELSDVEALYNSLMGLIVKLGSYGMIHCDFNEYSIMIMEDGKPVVIDFVKMKSTSHINAHMLFERDVDSIRDFFKRRFGYESSLYPKFDDLSKEDILDAEVNASGFTQQMGKDLLGEVGFEEAQDEEQKTDDGSGNEKKVQEKLDKVTKKLAKYVSQLRKCVLKLRQPLDDRDEHSDDSDELSYYSDDCSDNISDSSEWESSDCSE